MRAACLLPLLLLATACGRPSEATVEIREGDSYRPLAVDAYALTGSRDGSTTAATATLTLADGRRLVLELELFYDPTPELSSGHWILAGTSDRGAVSAESVRFAGGQGEGPSLGGRFRLEQDGEIRYRVELPLAPIATDWTP